MMLNRKSGLRKHSKAGRKPRKLRPELLEDRRLLATLEGSTYTLPRQVLPTIGFDGNLTASVNWGDGTSTPVTVDTPSPPNGVRIRFDYSLDTRNFFNNSSKKALLQQSADAITQYFGDSLSAIVPSGNNTWTTQVCHPSQGASNQLCGPSTDVSNRIPSVAENEIVVFVGSRDLITNVRGVAGPGSFSASGDQAWLDTVAGRGQAGATGSVQTDFATFGGSISFDTNGTDWYFGRNIAGIQPGQVDFMSVAMHEIMHVLGFGFRPIGGAGFPDVTSSWERLAPGATFNGSQARSAYQGSGFPPVDTNHWEESVDDVQATLMGAQLGVAQRQLLTRLDLAAMDDIGWQVSYPANATIQASHVYADDGDYNVTVTLNGSGLGQTVVDTIVADINNVAPSLTLPPTQTVTVGNPISLPESLWQITDPGYATETFTYTIDWKDGTTPASGNARIITQGNADRNTVASLSASHTYAEVGTYDVVVTVQDDDDGTARKSFRINVVPPPSLSLALSRNSISENAGSNAATLTVTRSGPALNIDQTVVLDSSDTTEASLPSQVLILAGETSATVPITAVDDTLLDGLQTVVLTAGATGVEGSTTELQVTDSERIIVELSAEGVLENRPDEVVLSVTRSNTDVSEPLVVGISGGSNDQLEMPSQITIPAEQRRFAFRLNPVDDSIPESTNNLSYAFTAPLYDPGSIVIRVFDDEQSAFQNPQDAFDVDGANGVTANDALRIINALGRITDPNLDPTVVPPDGTFPDTTGDYLLTSRDALVVINEIAKRSNESRQGEEIGALATPDDGPTAFFAQLGKVNVFEDDDEENLMYDLLLN